jgi:hypothetical protein
LHYFLRERLPRAKEMYAKALELARTALADVALEDAARAALEVTVRDAAHNLGKLERGDLVAELEER